MEERLAMLCVSKKQVEENPGLFIYPGSVEKPCADCGEPVFVSPATQDVMKRATVILFCPSCFLKRAEAEKEPVEFQVLPETAREVALIAFLRNRQN